MTTNSCPSITDAQIVAPITMLVDMRIASKPSSLAGWTEAQVRELKALCGDVQIETYHELHRRNEAERFADPLAHDVHQEQLERDRDAQDKEARYQESQRQAVSSWGITG